MLELMSSLPETEQRADLLAGGLVLDNLKNLSVRFRTGNTSLRKDLETVRLVLQVVVA